MHNAKDILDVASNSAFDFRRIASPDDQFKHLFNEWVPYYRLKWAIGRVLQPRRILEIGVGFGYAAAAFLDACPDANYLGIDDDSAAFGGQKGPIDWARHITRGANAEYLIADSRQLDELPGGPYDLIHIDGRRGGAGLARDLENALKKGKHILVAGYFGDRDNFLNISEFFYHYRDFIESCLIIPGHFGELLITARPTAQTGSRASSSGELKDAYSLTYYLEDCGGFDAYKRDMGGNLADARLQAVGHLVGLAPVGRALDLGCGRGEVSIHLARLGHDVTAVDYSESAIELARAAFERAVALGGPRLKISFHRSDVNALQLSGDYNVAVASDMIEHLAPAELDCLYGRLSAHLAPLGMFVVHTTPSAWFYRYEYARRVREAGKIGAYLPREPRTRYEKMMHINEQSPRILKRQLSAHFKHVLVWFSSHDLFNPFENLKRPFSKSEMRAAGDLFAIASHAPFAIERILKSAQMHPVAAPVDLLLDALDVRSTVRAGSRFRARLRLTNNSRFDLSSSLPNPVHLSYHCYSATLQLITWDGLRSRLPYLKAGSVVDASMQIAAPFAEGRFLFRLTLVQEGVRWFDESSQNVFADKWIAVVSS